MTHCLDRQELLFQNVLPPAIPLPVQIHNKHFKTGIFANGINLMPSTSQEENHLQGMEKLKEMQKAQWMNGAAVNHVHLKEKRRL